MRKEIIVFGGGKGGTGKSSIALNYATLLAQNGSKAVLLDIDLGAANLHTMLGIHTPERGIAEFLLNNKNRNTLDYFAIKTKIANLEILSAANANVGLANIEYQRKKKLINAIKNLDYQYIICDLGAGSSFNTIDFFAIANKAYLLTLPEPTALLNSYEFLKNLVFRKLKSISRKDDKYANIVKDAISANENLNEILKLLKTTTIPIELQKFFEAISINLIMNKTSKTNRTIGEKLKELSKKYLNLNLNYIGNIEENKTFSLAITKGIPVVEFDKKVNENLTKIFKI